MSMYALVFPEKGANYGRISTGHSDTYSTLQLPMVGDYFENVFFHSLVLEGNFENLQGEGGDILQA